MKIKNKLTKPLKAVFSTMMTIFALLVGFFFIPMDNPLRRGLFLVAAVFGLLFLILGIVLIVLAARSRLDKKLRVLLIIIGASAVGPLVGSVLHNVFYAFGMMTENMPVLPWVFEVLHVAFFLIALLVCPLVFLVCVVWSIVLLRKGK